jgi:RNA polymerase sigma-70 factor, ECF subfamily
MNSAPELELEWLRRVAKGDRPAFERLYHSYQKRIFGYLFRMVGASDPAEELTNDVMLEVWKGAGGFKGESKVSTWIFGIARFRALTWLRRGNPTLVDVEEAGQLSDPNELQDEVLMKQGVRDKVRKALANLTRQHKEVMELTFYQGFSYPEIADILQCPLNTVKTRMFHARKQLRELLGAEGAP